MSRPAVDLTERRLVTIMFCDLVNSVGLSSHLDPEDWQDVIDAYHRTCLATVEGHGGLIFTYMGDGLLICFGYPAANEDDAERAIRAGLDLVHKVGGLQAAALQGSGIVLQVRIGIASGLVVAGEAANGRTTLSGEAVNLASRLQGIAGADQIAVSAMTRELAAENFSYLDLGPQHLKGFEAPVQAYRIAGTRQVSRLEARSSVLAHFVGRDAELDTLLRHHAQALAGRGQVVLLAGEAGIGKSRIAAELQRRLGAVEGEAPGLPSLVFQCSPHHGNAPLHPVARQLEREAGLAPTEADAARLAKLARMLGDTGPADPQAAQRLGTLLGIAQDDAQAEPAESAAVRRSLALEAVIDWCLGRARASRRPLIFEDVQWIDPTTRQLLARLVQRAGPAGILLLVTLRTGAGRAPADFLAETGLLADDAAAPPLTILEVKELAAADVGRLATAIADRPISPAQLAAVLAKSEGIPLYVEELTKVVTAGLDLGALRAEEDGTTGIPGSIRSALMAQLDRLGPAKTIAQHAAVIGHEFSTGLLAQILGAAPDGIAPQLGLLAEAGILSPAAADAPAIGLYRFRHALIRDVAYRSLLRKARRAIHLGIADALAADAAETGSAIHDLIAQHYSQGGDLPGAIRFWQQGAREAIARSANEEALGMLEAALRDFRRLPGARQPRLELDLVLSRATVLRSLNGYSAPEVEQGLLEARSLCIATGDTASRFNVEWGLFQCMIVKADMAAAQALAAGLYLHAESHPGRPIVDAHLASGMAALNCGDFQGAARFLQDGVTISDPERDPPHVFTHGQNPGLFCLSYLARTQCFLGQLARARRNVERALAISAARAGELGHIHSHLNALAHAVRFHHLCGEVAAERALAEEMVAFAERHHYAYYAAVGACHLGSVIGSEGDPEAGIARMSAGIAALARTGNQLGQLGFLLMLAPLLLRAGRPREAWAALEQAIAQKTPGLAVWDAEIDRVRGDLLCGTPQGDPLAAERAYRASIATATAQKAGLLTLKAAFGLARLLDRQGRGEEGTLALVWGLAQVPEPAPVPIVRAAEAWLQGKAARPEATARGKPHLADP